MIRIVRGTPGTITAVFTVDDTATDLDSPPTVTVTAANGNGISRDEDTVRIDVGTYTYRVPALSDLTNLTTVWSGELDGSPVSTETYASVVGSEYFSIAELRNFDPVLLNETRYPTAKLVAARLAVESEFEGICGRAFVPQYAKETLYGDGTGVLWLSNPDPLRMISCTVNGEDWSTKNVTRPDHNLRVLVLDVGQAWTRDASVAIEYEYGFPEVPVRIKEAAMKRARYRVVADSSRIDERATVMNIPEFGNFTLATPGVRGSYTGIPEVDVVLQDYELR